MFSDHVFLVVLRALRERRESIEGHLQPEQAPALEVLRKDLAVP
jgi:hypothetical protein